MLKGKIVRYSQEEKRGIIYYKEGSIGFNSFNIKSHEKYCRVGAECEFEIMDYAGRQVANNIYVSEAFPNGKKLHVLGEKYDIREIKAIGLSSGYKVLKEMGKTDLFEEAQRRKLDLRFIYLTFVDGSSYRYFDFDSPIIGDGKCNLDEEWDNIRSKIYERN